MYMYESCENPEWIAKEWEKSNQRHEARYKILEEMYYRRIEEDTKTICNVSKELGFWMQEARRLGSKAVYEA